MANAQIVPTTTVGEAYKSVAELDGISFAIVNTADGKALHGSNNQNLAYSEYSAAFSSGNTGYMWKLVSVPSDADEAIQGCYYLQLITPKGENYNCWGMGGYLNSQPATGGCSFILGLNNQHGQDGANLAVYDIQYVEDQGFVLKNIGTGMYQGYNNLPANSADPVYWTFAPVESSYVPALESLLAEGEAMKATVTRADAVAAYEAAITGIDPATTTDALADAKKVDAAIIELAKAIPAVAGADFTRAIVNPSFEAGSIEGWTESYGGNSANNGNFGAAAGSYFVERWQDKANGGLSDGSIMQTITGLPNGTYKLTAPMQNLEQNNSDAAGKGYLLVANDDSTEVAVSGETVEVTTEVTDGTLTIGAVLKGCTGNWVCVDNFQLTLVEAAPVFYSVAIAEVENGTVTTTPVEYAIEGEEVALAITPAKGYVLESLSVVSGETAIEVSESYVFIMPAADVTVNATFAPIKIEPTIISPTIAVGEAYTSVEALKDAHFAITAEGKALYGSDNQNAAFNDFAQAFKSTNSGYMWKLVSVPSDADEAIQGCYYLQLITPKGENYNCWGMGGYLNSQPATGGCSFILGLNNQHGQDGANLAVYDIQYVEDQGFVLKNIGTGLYQGADAAPANKENPTYFTLAPVSSTYVPALEAMLAEGESWKAIISDAEAVAAYDAAIAGIDPATTEDALADAKKVDAAISELAKAQTAAAGVSFTRAIVNPSFELGDRTGWEENYGGNTSGTNNFGKKTGAIFLERWTGAPGTLSDGYIQQTVAGLPNGTYKLTAEMQNLVLANDPATDGKGYYLVANGDSTEVAVAGETVEVTTEVTDGTITIAAAIKGCTGNWVCVDNFQLTLVEAAPVIAEKTYTLDVERYPGLGYGVTAFTPDFTEALAFLGIEDVTAATLVGINADGSEEAAPGPGGIDGWCNSEGTFVGWGTEAKICVKFFPSVPQYEICDMNGGDVVGTTYTVKYALKANDKTAIYAINVKFVEKPVIYLADYTAKAETVELKIAAQDAEGNWAAESATEAINVADITALVGENYVVYGVGAKDGDKETLTNSYSCDPHPGFWCLADGTADVWANSTFGVSFYADEGVFKTWTKAAVTEDLSTTFYFVNEEAKEYVAYKVVLCAPVAEEPEIGTVIHTIDFSTQETYPYFRMDGPEGTSFDVINGALVIENNAERTNPWDLQPFICDWFNLKLDYDYVVRITMKASADGGAQLNMGTWSASMYQQLSFTASEEYQTYEVTFPKSTVESSGNDVHILFQGGKFVGKVEIAKVEIIEIVPVAIESVETAAPAARKFIENGQVVIIKNGVKYNIAGQVIE